MNEDWLAARFEEQRPRLRAVAYRMLGSLAEADDAVQESWLRLSRADTSAVANLDGWLTTVVSRECLRMLRSRRGRREEPLDEAGPGRPSGGAAGGDPEAEAMLADAVGPALMIVLDALGPAERLAFVLHDIFAVPFEEVGTVLDRSPAAARQLASRARRRVQGVPPPHPADLSRQREVVAAFLTALRDGDFGHLVALLDPEVVLLDDSVLPHGSVPVRSGARDVGRHALGYSKSAQFVQPATVKGLPGLAIVVHGQLMGALAFAVEADQITAIEMLARPENLAGRSVRL